MNSRRLGGLTVAFFSAGLTLGAGLAAAQPDDYSALIIDPNVVTDSQAYTAGPPTMNPGGQPGATKVFTHRDGGRTITDTVWVLSDPAAASSALNQAQSTAAIGNQKLTSAAVGSGARLITGTSSDGTQSVSVLYFTEGNAASAIEFAGPAGDPVPSDLVIEMGQKQDALIKSQLGT